MLSWSTCTLMHQMINRDFRKLMPLQIFTKTQEKDSNLSFI